MRTTAVDGTTSFRFDSRREEALSGSRGYVDDVAAVPTDRNKDGVCGAESEVARGVCELSSGAL